jgi:hypothetical protein
MGLVARLDQPPAKPRRLIQVAAEAEAVTAPPLIPVAAVARVAIAANSSHRQQAHIFTPSPRPARPAVPVQAALSVALERQAT